jgi:hypothetical protein
MHDWILFTTVYHVVVSLGSNFGSFLKLKMRFMRTEEGEKEPGKEKIYEKDSFRNTTETNNSFRNMTETKDSFRKYSETNNSFSNTTETNDSFRKFSETKDSFRKQAGAPDFSCARHASFESPILHKPDSKVAPACK